MKRILAVHDLSCHGAASLGIAIPVLTASGYKVIAFPSVILSSTTDLDQDPVALATTEWMRKVAVRWREQRLMFDAIYTGWLGDPEQISILADICDHSRHKKTVIFIDPVLGDGGVLYPCQEELARVMSEFAVCAHAITPNPTEAALLLRKQPKDYCIKKEDGTITVEKACELADALATAYPKTLPIIKSVVTEDRIGVCVKFTQDNTTDIKKAVTEIFLERRAVAPIVGGTGDLFASLLVARWLRQNLNNQSSQRDKAAVIKSVVKTISDTIKTVERENLVDLPFRKLLHIDA